MDPDGNADIIALNAPRRIQKLIPDFIVNNSSTNCGSWALGLPVNPLTNSKWENQGYTPGQLTNNLAYQSFSDRSEYLNGALDALKEDLNLLGRNVTEWKNGDPISKDEYIIGIGMQTKESSTSRNTFHMIRGDLEDKKNGKIYWSEKTGMGQSGRLNTYGTKTPVETEGYNPKFSDFKFLRVREINEK